MALLTEEDLTPAISGQEIGTLVTLERGLRIVIALKSRWMTVEDIADCFDLSVRGSYRYLNTIIASGLELEQNASKQYRLKTNL